MEAAGSGLDSSFDSRDDQELYARLMSERQRIQRQHEERRRQKAVRGKHAKPARNLEERERGFQLYISGANEERAAEEARRLKRNNRRTPGAPSAGGGADSAQTQWQFGTVELKGKDGQIYRSSPQSAGEGVWRPGADGGDQPIEEEYSDELDDPEAVESEREDVRGEAPDGAMRHDCGQGSRPGTGASVSSIDQDTKGVLHMMHNANKEQLMTLRACLTSQIAGGAAPGRTAAAPMSGQSSPAARLLRAPQLPARPGSGGAGAGEQSRPTSSSSAILSAIQAENARARAAGAGSKESPDTLEPTSSRPSSRPSSKAGRRLPLNPEAAMECAPPSALGSSAASLSGVGDLAPAAAAAVARQSSLSSLAVHEGGLGGGGGASFRPLSPAISSSQSATSSAAAAAAIAYPARTSDHGGGAPAASLPLAPGWGATPAAPSQPASYQGTGAVGAGTDIVDRVSRLDKRKQKALLRVLESLEAESPECSSGGARQASPSPRPAREGVGGARAAAGAEQSGSLRVRVLSNWGDSRQCGLSLLEALDAAGEAVRLPRAAVALQGTQSGSSTLPRVLEGRSDTTSEKHMWLSTVCPRASGGFEPLDIVLSWPPGLPEPAALRLWNFNSPDGLDKGARHVEVCRSGSTMWSGEVPRGSGAADVTPAVIALDPGFTVPRPAAAAAAAAPVVIVVAAPPEPEVASSQDRPIWLGQGAAPPRRDEAEEEEEADGDGPPAELGCASAETGVPRRSARRRQTDDELQRSLLALEKFSSSQSRRFFSSAGLDSAQGPDAGLQPPEAPEAQSGALKSDASAGDARAVGIGVPAASQETSGGDSPHHLPLQAELQGLGLDIPIREFNDFDALDGLCYEGSPDQKPTLGSSIVNFNANESQSVVIPTLPRGRTLVLNCVSTWGDRSFVGLAGIEVFDERGFPVVMKDPMRQVSANPHSINVLPEYQDDPRTPDKLFDQVNLTRDDLHVWLAPFTPGQPHTVTVDLERQMGISMIRVWNYNKSRQHSSRGVRDLEILLDGTPVFVGEIRRAPGVLTSPEEACEHILFTQDEAALEAIEEHDWLPAHLPVEDEADGSLEASATATFGLGAAEEKALARAVQSRPGTAESRAPAASARSGADGRPLTRASDKQLPRGTLCESVTIVLHSTWGDPYYVGLTAMELLDASLAPIHLEADRLEAAPSDLNDIEGVEGDPRTIDKLLDGVTCTTDDRHMWLAPFIKLDAMAANRGTEGSARNLIKVELGSRREVAGFHFWNYNKNPEDTCRGVKEFSVYCDDRYIATFLCRKAPGHVNFDFKQVVLLDQPPGDVAARRASAPPVAPRMPSRGRSERQPTAAGAGSGARERSSSRDRRRAPSQERPRSGAGDGAPSGARAGSKIGDAPCRVQQQYETPLHPCGFVFKLLLLSTWSDTHYIGLDGVELYDLEGRPLRPRRVHSNHGSVRSLPGMESDVRTEDALLHGAPGSSGRMWLAPLVRRPPNSVELMFDEPAQVSALRVWNYSRTPSRGARDVELYVDDLLIYQGILRQEVAAGGAKRSGESVLFTTLPEMVEKERPFVYLPSAEELVAFFDERGRLDQSGGRPGESAQERPMTAVTRLR